MSSTPRLVQEHLEINREAAKSATNVGTEERIVSATAGSLILASTFLRRDRYRLWSVIGAGALIWRGLRGWCYIYDALGINTAQRSGTASLGAGEGIRLEQSVAVGRSPEDLFKFWRNLANLPTVFSHLTSVTEQGPNRSHWIAEGPLGIRMHWDAEIITEKPGEVIAWRSLPNSEVDTAGSVRFEAITPHDTLVHVLMRYSPPAGRLGSTIWEWLGRAPEEQLEGDLIAFKKTLESQNIGSGPAAATSVRQ